MDIIIFIVLLIYLFLFNDTIIIKRLMVIYILLSLLYKLYKCFFKKIIEGADNLGDDNDYCKKIYDILNENVLLLKDVNTLKQYQQKFDDINDKMSKNNFNLQRYNDDFIKLNDEQKKLLDDFNNKTNTKFDDIKKQFNIMRTGTINIGDIGGDPKGEISKDRYSGIFTSVFKDKNGSNRGDSLITIKYEDKGYVPIILLSIENNINNSGSNDISPPVIQNIPTKDSCIIYLEETGGIIQFIKLHVVLLKPNINF